MMSRDDLVRDGRFEEAVKSVIGPDGVRAGRNNLSGGGLMNRCSHKLDSRYPYHYGPQQVAQKGKIRGSKELLKHQ